MLLLATSGRKMWQLLQQCALISTDHTLVSSHCQQSVWRVCVLSGARSFFSAFAHLLLYFHFPSALISSGQKRRTATSAEAPFFLLLHWQCVYPVHWFPLLRLLLLGLS